VQLRPPQDQPPHVHDAAQIGKQVDLEIEFGGARHVVLLAAWGVGETHVRGVHGQGRPGTQVEIVAEPHLPAGRGRGDPLDLALHDRIGQHEWRGDQGRDQHQDDDEQTD
jgi:hypothetical protein